jgi:hypothetical protein
MVMMVVVAAVEVEIATAAMQQRCTSAPRTTSGATQPALLFCRRSRVRRCCLEEVCCNQ